jgi:peroxiredoxin
MKSTFHFRHRVPLLTLLAFSIGCSRPSEQKKEDVAFVPHPVKIEKREVVTLATGTPAPDFNLPDTQGKFMSLADFKEAKVLVIVFTCNHCPTAQAYEDRIIQFTNDYKNKGVAVVAIMPNSMMGLLPEEGGYTDVNDSYDDMKVRYADKKFNFPYLYDGDDQAIAIKYGPVSTPHAFVLDADRRVRYTGRLDAVENPKKPGADAGDLRAAVDALLAGKEVAQPVNKAFGCSIKWSWKDEWAKKVVKEWSEKPVALEKISEDGIKKLVANSSGKLRLINVWATWCAPCVAEYSEMVIIQRQYSQRDFELVSLSADKPDKEDKALAFLKEKNSALKNYLYEGTDKYKMIEALDSAWNGALPYTMLVEPGGKIVYRYQGAVDFLELRKAIVGNKMIGRLY